MDNNPPQGFDWKDKYFDSKIDALIAFMQERDRRYTEVNVEREKALKIKEEADKTALGLQRDNQISKDEKASETQIYKDEKANNLRSQIESERGSYATHLEIKALDEKFQLSIKPIVDYISSQRGGQERSQINWSYIVGAFGIGMALAMYFK